MVVSCQSSEFHDIENADLVPISDTLNSQIVYSGSEADPFNPIRIVNVNDEYLVVSNERKNGIFQVFQIPGLELLYSWGNVGEGPDEFRMLPVIEINVKNNELIFYEIITQQLRHYAVSDSSFEKIEEIPLSYTGQTDPLNHLQRLNDSLYIADYGTAFENSDHEYIALRPGENEPLFTFGSYPDSDLEGFERYRQYLKTNAAKPDESKFAAFYAYHNWIKIFNSEGGIIKAIQVRDSSLSEEDIREDFYMYRKVICASDHYIYTLGQYTTSSRMNENLESYNNSLEVWNWEGELVYRAMFDKPVNDFTVSEEYGKLYGISFYVIPELYEFDLPESLNFN